MFLRSVAIASLVAVSLGQIAIAQPLIPAQTLAQLSGEAEGRFGEGRVLQQLNLSQEQRQQIQRIFQQYRSQIMARRQSLQGAQGELQQLMASNASAATVRSKHQEVRRLRQELGDLFFESTLEVREILTPEQRSEFAQIMQQGRQRLREGRPQPLMTPLYFGDCLPSAFQ
ncbi:MAG: periplasmic heavy metal sensor [Chloroflexaceae bacterium]|nr:periplasmic heavy metal sensor [Chloroflexaceae bacterium]